jgi:hypothetical protein
MIVKRGTEGLLKCGIRFPKVPAAYGAAGTCATDGGASAILQSVIRHCCRLSSRPWLSCSLRGGRNKAGPSVIGGRSATAAN